MWVLGAKNQQAGQAAGAEIELEAGFGPDPVGLVAIDAPVAGLQLAQIGLERLSDT